MTEQQTVELSRNSQEVIDNEAYKQAMTGLKAQIVEQWERCPIVDPQGALLLLQLVKLCDKFESILHGMIANGKLAKHDINLDAMRNESKARTFFRRVA